MHAPASVCIKAFFLGTCEAPRHVSPRSKIAGVALYVSVVASGDADIIARPFFVLFIVSVTTQHFRAHCRRKRRIKISCSRLRGSSAAGESGHQASAQLIPRQDEEEAATARPGRTARPLPNPG